MSRTAANRTAAAQNFKKKNPTKHRSVGSQPRRCGYLKTDITVMPCVLTFRNFSGVGSSFASVHSAVLFIDRDARPGRFPVSACEPDKFI